MEKENGLPACLWDKCLSNNCACLWQVFCALFLHFIGRCLISYHQASDNLKVLAQLKSLLGRYFFEAWYSGFVLYSVNNATSNWQRSRKDKENKIKEMSVNLLPCVKFSCSILLFYKCCCILVSLEVWSQNSNGKWKRITNDTKLWTMFCIALSGEIKWNQLTCLTSFQQYKYHARGIFKLDW